jgi:histidine ammonia-lyase
MTDQTPGRFDLGRDTMTLAVVDALANGNCHLAFPSNARRAVEASRQMVIDALERETPVYGVTTGFGALSSQSIPVVAGRELQENLLRSHASGVGRRFNERVIRTMIGLRAHALALGYSGIRTEIVERLIEFYARNILPVVPEQGSVGASGDLAPLAHLALPLIGEGRVTFEGEEIDAGRLEALVGLEPLQLEPKESLALINGTQTMTAIGALATIESSRVIDASIAAGSLTLIAMNGHRSAFDARLQRTRPHPGQIEVAHRLRYLLGGWSADTKQQRSVQDRYSLRAIPPVIGAIRDALEHVRGVVEIELNSATDNPLFFPDDDLILTGANFHGHPIALACDHLKTAMASLTTFSERRIATLVDSRASGLPAFLAREPGLNSGLMIPHYLAASLVAENRALAHPASVDSLSTSADVEDYNSMGTIAARTLSTVVDNAARIVAVELLCAAQAIDLRGVEWNDAPVQQVYSQVRNVAPFTDRDQFGLGDLITELARRIQDGNFVVPRVPDSA